MTALEQTEALDTRLRKAGVCIFLAVDREVAKDIAALVNEAATELQRVWPLLQDAQRLLTEINKRHSQDDMPAAVYALLSRMREPS